MAGTSDLVFYTGVARSHSGSSSFTALAPGENFRLLLLLLLLFSPPSSSTSSSSLAVPHSSPEQGGHDIKLLLCALQDALGLLQIHLV